MPRPQVQPCQAQACALQNCLAANDYQQEKCQKVIDALRACCANLEQGQTSVCCEGWTPKRSTADSAK